MLAFLAGCGADEAGGSKQPAAEDAPPPQIELAVSDGSADVSPVVPLEISVTDGEVAGATVVDGDGAEVPGSLAESPENPDARVFTPETPLAYSTSYTLTATATNEEDDEAEATSTFTTATPESLSTPSIGPLDGMVVGVGMPIRVYFDDPVADKAAVEGRLLVTSSTPTDGPWNWFSD